MSLQVFNTWDEINIGDEISWGDGKSHQLKVTGVPKGGRSLLTGIHKKGKFGENPGWSTIIAGDLDSLLGWKKIITELKYDPMQQGDKDEDI